jgi:hypothetical protein
VREVRLQQQRTVPLRPICPFDSGLKQGLNGRGVPLALIAPDDRQGEDFLVRLHHLRGAIGRTVVEEEDVILSGKVSEDLADLPQEDADGIGLVVTRNADVNHWQPVRKALGER